MDDDPTKSHDEDDEVEAQDRYWPPPTADVLKLSASSGNKTVCALSFNSSGTALATGGHDLNVNIFEFATVSQLDPSPTYTAQPCEHHVIKALDFSKYEEFILVVPGSSQAKIISKDGLSINNMECAQGYQYMRDLNKTKGHTAMLNDGCWSKRDQNTFITCSNDCTIRIWNTEDLSGDKQVIKARSPKTGLPVIPNVCRYSKDHLLIASGCNDGSILMWDTRKKFINTSVCVKNAHQNKNEITSLDFSYANSQLVSRSCDGSCKLWDMRNLKAASAINAKLTNDNESTDVQFSPDDKTIITGIVSQGGHCGLAFLDAINLDLKQEINTDNVGVVKCKWHPRTNQIAIGCTDGAIKIFYDGSTSNGGSQLFGSKMAKKRRWNESIDTGKIITPHALPQFKHDFVSSRTAQLKERLDPVKSKRPELPVKGRGQQGRLTAPGSTLSSYIAKNIAKPLPDDGLDVRQKILRHAEEAEKNPYWFAAAYAKTNTNPQLASECDNEDDGSEPASKRQAT